MVDGIGRERVRESMYVYGLALDAVRPLGRAAIASACSLPSHRARRLLCGGMWHGHCEGRRILRLAELLPGGELAPGCAAVEPTDFRQVMQTLYEAQWCQSAIGRRTGIALPTLCRWAKGVRTPSWVGGEALLWHAQRMVPGAGLPEPVS